MKKVLITLALLLTAAGFVVESNAAPATGAIDAIPTAQPVIDRIGIVVGNDGKPLSADAQKELTNLAPAVSTAAQKLLGANNLDKQAVASAAAKSLTQTLEGLKQKVQAAQAQQLLQGAIDAIGKVNSSLAIIEVAAASEQLHDQLGQLPNILGKAGDGFAKLKEAGGLLAIARAKRLAQSKPVVAALLLYPIKDSSSVARGVYNKIWAGLNTTQRNTLNKNITDAKKAIANAKQAVATAVEKAKQTAASAVEQAKQAAAAGVKSGAQRVKLTPEQQKAVGDLFGQ